MWGSFGLAKPRVEDQTVERSFSNTFKDIHFAEKKILLALPKMAKVARPQGGIRKARQETEGQVERLESVFEEIEARTQGKTCDAIVGIIEEGKEIIKEYRGSPALDAGLLAAAQAVEHYEISRYGTLIAWAQQLGLQTSTKLLKETLAGEEKTDKSLSSLAESLVNQEASAPA